ncbi:MAG: polysaccharide lyase [Myxococcaceae bacterium]|nr:polysaccharide lyase [Myxococcaceae bacterium]
MNHRTLMLAALVLPALASADVVWRGDFETGDRSQWSKTQMVNPDRLQVVESPVRSGKYALRALVKQGDDPINASGNRNELLYHSREAVGSEYYYRWSTMFAPDYPSAKTWQLFAQWHHYGCCGSPPIQFIVNGEEMILAAVGQVVWKAPLVRGMWNDFIFHVKWSPDAREGFIELYRNGKLEAPKTFVATMFPNDFNYIKLGLYRNSTIAQDGVVFHDDFVMATTLEDVLASGSTPSSQPGGEGPALPSTLPEPGATPAPRPGEQAAVEELDPTGGPSGGCSAGPSGLLAVLGLLPLMPLLRRRRR